MDSGSASVSRRGWFSGLKEKATNFAKYLFADSTGIHREINMKATGTIGFSILFEVKNKPSEEKE